MDIHMNKYISIIDMVILLDDDEFHGVCFAYGTYEHDHRFVCVLRDVAPVDEQHLVALVQPRYA